MNQQGNALNQSNFEEERQEAIERLTNAFAKGDLEMNAYEDRVSLANKVSTAVDLLKLTIDLPAGTIQPFAKKHPAQNPTSLRNKVNRDLVNAPRMNTGCIMGSRNLTGNWLSSDRVSAFTVMGSTHMDFHNVDLPPGPVYIELYSLMGEVKITVPANLAVRLNVTPFMGDCKANRSVNQQTANAESWLEISGFVMMGEVTVNAT